VLQIVEEKTRSFLCKDFYIYKTCNTERLKDDNRDTHEYQRQDERYFSTFCHQAEYVIIKYQSFKIYLNE